MKAIRVHSAEGKIPATRQEREKISYARPEHVIAEPLALSMEIHTAWDEKR